MVTEKALKKFFHSLKKKYWYQQPYCHFDDILIDIKRTIKEKKKKNQIFVILSTNGKIFGLAKVAFLLFDKKVFGFNCGRIEYLIFGDFVSENLKKIFIKRILEENRDKKFIDIGIDAQNIFLERILKKLGFKKITEHLIYYQKLISNFTKFKVSEILIRKTEKEDLPILKKLSGNSFIYSRFYQDKNFPPKLVKKFYENWFLNSFKNKSSHQIFTAQLNNQIVGFLDCKILQLNKRRAGIIDLIAVDKNYQGKGVGKSLLTKGLTYFQKRKIKEVYAGTERENLAAQKMYESVGMKIIAKKESFHFWERSF